ncbi:MAG: hypothetical protein KF764_19785 [Labilithrix sp.]|nr:hypothetical protein [Labilithrix sp.]MBX3222845.1 hypothetical protein [Labilithrix sp.]
MLPRRSPVASTIVIASAASPVRLAATEFVRGTTFGWGKRELAAWLVCHYAPCLASDAVVHPDGAGPRSTTHSGPLSTTSAHLDGDRVERLILEARSSVLRLLADLAWPSQAAVRARSAIAAGFVIETRAPRAESVWAPVGRKRMRLADRVASLFIADAIDNPHDYRGLSLCRACGEVGFGGDAAHEPSCERARHVA